MSDLQNLLDQIDRLDGELLPDWKYNDRTGAVIANGYRKQGDGWSCLVVKDISADCDGEFIALARTVLPALSRAVRAVLELHKPFHADHYYNGMDGESLHKFVPRCEGCDNAGGIEDYPCPTVQAITDALGDDDD